MKKQFKAGLLMFLAAFIWGTAFVAQSIGMGFIGPLTFGGIRMLIGAAVLLPVIAFRTKRGTPKPDKAARKELLRGGLFCGLALFAGATLQQIGLTDTDPGKAAFITAMYIVLVPVLGIFLGKKLSVPTVISVLLGVTGLYLLCAAGGMRLSVTDLCLVGCSLCYSVHILTVDHFASHCDPIRLSAIQFVVAGVLDLLLMPFFETPTVSGLMQGAWSILYAGVLSSGVAFTLQTVSQKDLPAAAGSLIMSFESVFSVLAGAVVLHNVMTKYEIAGCILMFTAVLVSELGGKLWEKLRGGKRASA